MNGFEGLALGEDGHLYVANGLYKNIKEFNPQTKQFVGTFYQSPNFSFIDDIVLIPRDDARGIPGGFSATQFLDGRIPTISTDGATVIQSNPGPFVPCATCGAGVTFDPNFLTVNPIAYRSSDDRLYLATTFNPTRILKLDWRGTSPAVSIPLSPPTALNGFNFGPDGFLYASVPNGDKVVKIDVDTGVVTDVVTGVPNPISVDVDNQGKMFIVSRSTGKLYKFDPATSTLSVFATLEPALDNLAIDNANRKIYVTNDQNQIWRVDADTADVKLLFSTPIVGPAELALTGDSLYLDDTSGIKEVDAKNGKIIRSLVASAADSALFGMGILASITVENDANGKILVLDVTGNLRVINKSDFALHETFPATQTLLIGKQPYSAVRIVDGASEYYLVTNVVDGKVVKVARVNGAIVVTDFLTGLLAPVKLKVSDGFVYVVESGDVLHDVPNTGKVRKVALNNPGNQIMLLENLNNPQGLDIYNNKIVVTLVGDKKVIEASATGPSIPTTIYKKLKCGLSPLVSPLNPVPIESLTGVAVNSSGSKIYVTQNKPNNILLIKR